MAAPPSLSNTSDKNETINWLSHQRLITDSQKQALQASEDFAGVPDLLPFLRDDGLDNLKAVLEEVDPQTRFKLISVGRIKQQMCAVLGAPGIEAQPAAPTAEPDTDEVEGKLQDVGKLADDSWANKDELAAIVSGKMSFHSDDIDKDKGPRFITNLYDALNGNGDDDQSVRDARQLKLVGPSNNGKTCLAQWMARMWVASATDDGADGRWIETFVTMETMDAHLWSARESTGSAPREVWGPLRYLFQQSLDKPDSRFALVLHESNRGGLFNALNRIWWEKRRNYPSSEGVPNGEELPPNLALIFTENPATADYATIGDGDDALRTRLPPESTFALVRGGTNESELAELGFSGKEGRHFSTENVGLFYAMAEGRYDSPAWKHHLGCLAQGTIPRRIDGVDFEDSFGMAPDEFRTRVAGEQIDIIRNNPPDSDPPDSEATYQQAPLGAQQPNQESKLGKRTKQIRTYLSENSDTLLAFVHDEVANRGTNQQFYKYLRGQLQPPHFRATVNELVGKAQKMTPSDKTTFGLNECSFERRCNTTGQLISWISFTQGTWVHRSKLYTTEAN